MSNLLITKCNGTSKSFRCNERVHRMCSNRRTWSRIGIPVINSLWCDMLVVERKKENVMCGIYKLCILQLIGKI